jgi:hypothetical protein
MRWRNWNWKREIFFHRKVEIGSDRAPRRLWDRALYELHKRLMVAVDALNAKWGKDAVRCGLFPSSGAWRTRFERRSLAYTTDWRQLMTAH